ncbi:MAG: hypothetical protein LBG80_03105 [Bacteroidales bacterium]|jgi:hypothetical protein|nr:hypothetical protein [Bacteroidales bacterium]
MALNLLKRYNQLLELTAMNEFQRKKSLRGILNRDIANNPNFMFRRKQINPTPANGQDSMNRLFTHLTTVVTDKNTNKREFDMARSVRLHWIKYHIEENKRDNMFVFSVEEPMGTRTYIYDKVEEYVIVLEPMRKKDEYYLLTAYYLEGKDKARNKMMKKYKMKLNNVV